MQQWLLCVVVISNKPWLLPHDKTSETPQPRTSRQCAVRILRVVLERHGDSCAEPPESNETPANQQSEPPTENKVSHSPLKMTLRPPARKRAASEDCIIGPGRNILQQARKTRNACTTNSGTLHKSAEEKDETDSELPTRSVDRRDSENFSKYVAEYNRSKVKDYYSCKLCPYGTHRKRNFVVHVRTHTGEKPHCCEVCNDVFAQKAQLLRHMKIHTGERPFECNICSMTFAERLTLKCHFRTHTGERPFKCPTCSRTFTQVGTMARHRRSHACKQQKVLAKPK
ncbi:zinc finger protein 337 [Rhipicephalus sanguineus]|uniref:zinc finger protein 337 n=1 Tax=Rhipicephalus sanguineus TaxID=34632 RepID=UPI0020C5A0C4|nr:zinc finger protein 337 [Rhipicephalus sanguineus]